MRMNKSIRDFLPLRNLVFVSLFFSTTRLSREFRYLRDKEQRPKDTCLGIVFISVNINITRIRTNYLLATISGHPYKHSTR